MARYKTAGQPDLQRVKVCNPPGGTGKAVLAGHGTQAGCGANPASRYCVGRDSGVRCVPQATAPLIHDSSPFVCSGWGLKQITLPRPK